MTITTLSRIRVASTLVAGLAPLLGVLIVLAAQGLASADTFEFVTTQLRAGSALVALSTLGLVAGCVGVVLSLRPRAVWLALLAAVLGASVNAVILWSFAPLLWGIYRD